MGLSSSRKNIVDDLGETSKRVVNGLVKVTQGESLWSWSTHHRTEVSRLKKFEFLIYLVV